MKEHIKKHFWYYLIFIGVEFAGIMAISNLAYDKFMRMIIVILMALFYIFWSMHHHYSAHNVTAKIVIEYVLIATLGTVILLFFLA